MTLDSRGDLITLQVHTAIHGLLHECINMFVAPHSQLLTGESRSHLESPSTPQLEKQWSSTVEMISSHFKPFREFMDKNE